MKRPTEAWMNPDLEEAGFGIVAVARFKGSGDAEVGVFLVDSFCLGIKNACFRVVSGPEYDSEFRASVFEGLAEPVSIPPADARALVEQVVAFAQNLGFGPHSDYKQAARVFGGIDAGACTRTFRFGRDGKPLYMAGPYDSEARIVRILETLFQKLGGGFDYVLADAVLTPRIEQVVKRIAAATGRPTHTFMDDPDTHN